MTDHAGHTPGMKMPAETKKESAPVKADSAAQGGPAKGDPHAGHKGEDSAKPAVSPPKPDRK